MNRLLALLVLFGTALGASAQNFNHNFYGMFYSSAHETEYYRIAEDDFRTRHYTNGSATLTNRDKPAAYTHLFTPYNRFDQINSTLNYGVQVKGIEENGWAHVNFESAFEFSVAQQHSGGFSSQVTSWAQLNIADLFTVTLALGDTQRTSGWYYAFLDRNVGALAADGRFVNLTVASNLGTWAGSLESEGDARKTLVSQSVPGQVPTFKGTISGEFWFWTGGFSRDVFWTEITAAAFATGDGANNLIDAEAFIDPYYSLTAEYQAQFPSVSLAALDGVGNAPNLPVPEPATYGLMVLGLCVVLISRRRAHNS